MVTMVIVHQVPLSVYHSAQLIITNTSLKDSQPLWPSYHSAYSEDSAPAIIKIIRKRIPPSILPPANPQFTINKETDNNNNSKHIKTRIRLPRLTIIPTIPPLNKQIPTYTNTRITLNLIPRLFTHTPNPQLKFTKINIQLKFPAPPIII